MITQQASTHADCKSFLATLFTLDTLHSNALGPTNILHLVNTILYIHNSHDSVFPLIQRPPKV